MGDKDFPIQLGTMIMIDPGDGWPRLKTILVGVDPGDSLILKADDWSPDKFRGAIEVGKHVVGRYLLGGRVYGFRAASLGLSAAPRQLLFIKYPDDVQEHNLRAAERVACSLPTKVHIDGSSVDALVVDLSLQGGQVAVAKLRQDSPLRVSFSRLNTTVELSVQFPGVAGDRSMKGTIKNVSSDADGMKLGIVFDATDGPGQEAVHAFLKSVVLT